MPSYRRVDARYDLVDDGVTIARALKHIPERERLVLALRFGEDLTQSEIAERIGVSQMQVSRLLRRALEQIRILARAAEPDEAEPDETRDGGGRCPPRRPTGAAGAGRPLNRYGLTWAIPQRRWTTKAQHREIAAGQADGRLGERLAEAGSPG